MGKLTVLAKSISGVALVCVLAYMPNAMAENTDKGKGATQPRGQDTLDGSRGAGKAGGSKSLEGRVLSDDGGTKGPSADSDAPAWAGPGATEPNPHQSGGGKPAGAGSKKGDLFGDLWVVLRDDNGVPILFKDADGDGVYDADEACTTSTDGCYPQPYYIDADNNTVLIALDAEGHPLDESQTVEVEFGRLNIGRSPTRVIDHSLETALDSILQAGAVLSLDASGRIVITVDGVSKTIDSPLENIALYVALLTDGEDLSADMKAKFDSAVTALSSLYSATYNEMDLAASLLAAGADKTGAVSVDMVAYLNSIYGITAMTPTDYVDYSTFDYDRSSLYNVTITYNELNPDGSTTPVTGTIMDLVFGGRNVTDSGGIDAFSQAADDALQVIEFLHEVIHDLQP